MLLNQNGFTTRKKICVSGTKKDRVVVFTTRLLQSREYIIWVNSVQISWVLEISTAFLKETDFII